jgi:methylated-DNA-[protein]-cysteine S-methyltransferase
MKYTCAIETYLGKLQACAEDGALIGLCFTEQEPHLPEPNLPIFKELRNWLDRYFNRNPVEIFPRIALRGTEFQKKVWTILTEIPFGETTTYGAIARKLGIKSAQAIGNAVGHNPISILVPCHRVIGSNGNLTGYAGGIDRKKALLEWEGHEINATYGLQNNGSNNIGKSR